MSILQEYAQIRASMRPGEAEALERYLSMNPDVLLSDVYYNASHWNAFQNWWAAEKAKKGVA